MIKLKLTDEQLDEMHREAAKNTNARYRTRCWMDDLKGMGYAHHEIARLVRVDESSITVWLKAYRDGGLPGLLADHYPKATGQLDAHAEALTALFKNRPPHTVNQAIEMIKAATGGC